VFQSLVGSDRFINSPTIVRVAKSVFVSIPRGF